MTFFARLGIVLYSHGLVQMKLVVGYLGLEEGLDAPFKQVLNGTN